MPKSLCKNKCELLPRVSPNNVRYQLGFRLCHTCECGFKTSELRCPCCNNRLRFKKHGKKEQS